MGKIGINFEAINRKAQIGAIKRENSTQAQ